ncbi:tyrosine-type recombinase/integrase [Thiocapsa bogorovii]|uniref:tyrosine-type recombinase/integrase n=1 Tax=Thiocapsa bogorovii TaxID=521689 RepID=UPI001E522128|nr:tyrosine-type recombinase/integrase [Thiocapsa bogorovii]UHD14594.1 site-specific integrase [Thiocapsa bogorovii]UHD14604.1 site-specific integrase [Thiocapsa bogorovii]
MPKPASPAPSFAALVQAYFTEYLTRQRALSPQTVAAYRDAMVLFLQFAQSHLGKAPVAMTLAEITPELLTAFLDHLEQQRRNCVRSRNARLAALRSFLKFAAHRDVASLQIVERALGIPVKRFERPMFGYLSAEEMQAVIHAPPSTWFGQRDHLLLQLLYNTGARVSEITQVNVGDVVLEEHAACVHLHGKGRKQRSVPLWRSTIKAIRAWLKQNPDLGAGSPLLPNRNGQAMTRTNVSLRLEAAVQTASKRYPALASRAISPHTIRHTTAMHLLQAGVDISVIALWLGHESPVTTHQYIEADLAMKEHALAKLQEPDTVLHRYRAPDSLIEFLTTL